MHVLRAEMVRGIRHTGAVRGSVTGRQAVFNPSGAFVFGVDDPIALQELGFFNMILTAVAVGVWSVQDRNQGHVQRSMRLHRSHGKM